MSSLRAPAADVRMRGFAARARVATALAWIDANVRALVPEEAALDELAGRVLAADVVAPIDVPAFDRAAMDGYALHAAETIGAAEYNPIELALVGTALPGRAYEGTVAPGTAVRIMTGAPMPAGADAVVPAEFATEREGRVEITAPLAAAKNVGRRAEDVRAGTAVLQQGRRLRPQDLGLLASLGIDRAAVVRRPRVRILASGDELVAPGTPKGLHQIYDANTAMLRALAARDGAIVESVLRLRDDRKAIEEAMTAPGADVLLVSGGSSVGAEDHAPGILAQVGELAIHGIAMRPSSPAGFGRLAQTFVFLLPGNPVSCLCAYDFFAGRALRLLGGRNPEWPHPKRVVRLRQKIASAVGRVDYCRVRLHDDEAEPLALSGASILSSTTRADAFVIVPEESEGYAAGAEVTAYLY